jgi:hypothetical protein
MSLCCLFYYAMKKRSPNFWCIFLADGPRIPPPCSCTWRRRKVVIWIWDKCVCCTSRRRRRWTLILYLVFMLVVMISIFMCEATALNCVICYAEDHANTSVLHNCFRCWRGWTGNWRWSIRIVCFKSAAINYKCVGCLEYQSYCNATISSVNVMLLSIVDLLGIYNFRFPIDWIWSKLISFPIIIPKFYLWSVRCLRPVIEYFLFLLLVCWLRNDFTIPILWLY